MPIDRSAIERASGTSEADQLIRRERARLVSNMVRILGNHNVELAEDVAHEALIRAMTTWTHEVQPENRVAWLTRVANNCAIDVLRKRNKNVQLDDLEDEPRTTGDRSDSVISDPELRLIFLATHPCLSGVDQLALTLRVVSGFSGKELAELFLSSEQAIGQHISRGKRKLSALDKESIADPTRFELRSRVQVVLKVIYLMFCLGYAPQSGNLLIRRDVANEALRLAVAVATNELTAVPEAHALAALLSFQTSRFDARQDPRTGMPILFKDQDRTKWDQALISQGVLWLHSSKSANPPSRYHFEAAIAAEYALSPSWDQISWKTIHTLYDELGKLVQSPVVELNRSVAICLSGNPAAALKTVESLEETGQFENYAPFYLAKAEILRALEQHEKANFAIKQAQARGASEPAFKFLKTLLQA